MQQEGALCRFLAAFTKEKEKGNLGKPSRHIETIMVAAASHKM